MRRKQEYKQTWTIILIRWSFFLIRECIKSAQEYNVYNDDWKEQNKKEGKQKKYSLPQQEPIQSTQSIMDKVLIFMHTWIHITRLLRNELLSLTISQLRYWLGDYVDEFWTISQLRCWWTKRIEKHVSFNFQPVALSMLYETINCILALAGVLNRLPATVQEAVLSKIWIFKKSYHLATNPSNN